MATLRELLVKIGVDADDRALKRFGRTVEKAKSGLVTLAKGAVAAGAAVAGAAGLKLKAARDTAEYATEITRMARALNISTDSAQELLAAFKRFDADASDVKDALGTITDRAEDAKGGMQSFIDDFKLVGLEVKELRGLEPEQLFETFAEAVATTEDPNKRLTAAVRILGDDLGQKLLPLLLEGRGGLEKMREEARALGVVLDKESIEKSARFNYQLERLDQLVKGVRNRLSVALMPKLEEAARKTVDWAVANREVIEQKIERFVDGLEKKVTALVERIRELGGGDFARGLKRIGQILASIVGAFAGMRVLSGLVAVAGTLKTVLAAVGAVGAVGLAKIIALVVAAIAYWGTLVLLIEDFITYLRGGDSLIGRVLARVKKGEGALGRFYKRVEAALSKVQAFFAGIGRGERVIDRVFGLLRARTRAVRAALVLLGNIARTIFVAMGRVAQAVFDKIRERAVPILQKIGGVARDVFIFMRNLLWLLWEKGGKPALNFLLTAFTKLFDKVAAGLERINERWGPVFDGAQGVVDGFISFITGLFDRFFDMVEARLGKFLGGWEKLKGLPGLGELFDEDFDPRRFGGGGAPPPASVVTRDVRARSGGDRNSVRVGGINAPITVNAGGRAPGEITREVREGLRGARESQLAARFGNGE